MEYVKKNKNIVQTAVFEPATPAIQHPQNYTLNRVVTGSVFSLTALTKFTANFLVFRLSQIKSSGCLRHRINPLTPELNPSAQRCLAKFFTGDFAS
jgi:hypothetical protein